MSCTIKISRRLVSPLICEPLAADAFERDFRAFVIVHAKRLAIVKTEVEFVHVALQMLMRDMVERADQSTLEDGEIAFNGIGGDDALRVDLAAMVDLVVLLEFLRLLELVIAGRRVGHEVRILMHMAGHDRLEVIPANIGNVHGADVAATFHKGNNLIHGGHCAAVLAALLAWLRAVVSFIPFNDLAGATHLAGRRGGHGFADTVRHEPSRLVSHAKHAFQLFGTYALLGSAHQVGCIDPFVKRDLGALKDCSYGHGELGTAVAARHSAGRSGHSASGSPQGAGGRLLRC